MNFDEQDDGDMAFVQQKPEEAPRVRKPKKIIIPRRERSVEISPPRVLVMTAGSKPKPKNVYIDQLILLSASSLTGCGRIPVFYMPRLPSDLHNPITRKLNECLVSPRTLYELAADVVDKLDYPEPFTWDEIQVADWMEQVVGFPQYKECILDNHINGKRLLRLEDPSDLAQINIRDFTHMKKITKEIRKVFATDYILFARSIGLPIRKPLTHCTWFKSRTGPSWGIRENWTRSDILRWMKILRPAPLNLDHWDLVWYLKPDWPKDRFGRIPKADLPREQTHIPQYEPPVEYCNEFTASRKFRVQANIPEDGQFIWMEHLPGSPSRREPVRKVPKKEEKPKKKFTKMSRLLPKKISQTGLMGKALILARRKMPKPKFLA